MDDFEKNENGAENAQEPQNTEEQQRNTEAPSGWTYSANTNQYSTEADAPQNNNRGEAQRKEYGTQYGYYSNNAQNPNYYSNNGANPYDKRNGAYQWDFNKYESADAVKTAKKKSGTGFKVFLAIIAVVLGVCILALSSVGIYSLVKSSGSESNSSGSYNEVISESGTQQNGALPTLGLEDKPAGDDTVSTEGKLSATEIYKTVSPSVVGVVQYQYSLSLEPASEGSGIIISEDGYILTNAHVVKDAEAIKIVLCNEEEYTATLVGSDEQTDIAVLKIEANNLTAAQLGDSSQVEVGETVYAIGNPGGLTLQSSFTNGIISGLNRIITTSDSSYSMSVIQTNAAINPGNSGGALVNEYGQVIGITNSKLISTEYEGVGFAIPTETAIPIVQELISNGYVSGRAKIGITGQSIDSVTAKYYSVPEGVQIITIDQDGSLVGTDAQSGDIIISFDGTDVTCMEDLQSLLAESKPGDVVTIELYRYSAQRSSDMTITITVTLIESKN